MASEILQVQGYKIAVDKDGYICLTDMAKADGDGSRAADKIKNWLNTKFTIDFLGTWETHFGSTSFKVVEFHHFRENVGKDSFNVSIESWVESADAIGIYSKKGKFSGTYAHKDIAFEFGTAISPVFKLHLLREYQKLKELESNADNVEWNVRRYLSKAMYHVQTDAVKNYKIPLLNTQKDREYIAYAEEGDILNLALFGFTAKKWKESNVELVYKGRTMREYASTNELTVLGSLEGINAEMLKKHTPFDERLTVLKAAAIEQLATLNRLYPEKSLRKNDAGNFQAYFKNDALGMFPAKVLNN